MKKYLWLAVMAAGVLAVTACEKKEAAPAPTEEVKTTQQVASEAEAAAQEMTEGETAGTDGAAADNAGENTDNAAATDLNSAEAKAGEDQQY